MRKEILTFVNIEIAKNKFYHHKNRIFWEMRKYQYLKRFLLVNKTTEKKYFTGYLYDNHKVKPLHIMLPKTIAYVKSYDGQTKWMYFFIEDDDVRKI